MQLAINFDELYFSLPGFRFALQASPSTGDPLSSVISFLLPYLFVFAGLLLLIYFIFGGFTYLTSAGDPKKMDDAKGKITGALVGFLIIFVSFWVVQFISRALGLQPIIDIFG